MIQAIASGGPFDGVRVVVHTSRAYDDVLVRLRKLTGATFFGEVVALAEEPITEQSLRKRSIVWSAKSASCCSPRLITGAGFPNSASISEPCAG